MNNVIKYLTYLIYYAILLHLIIFLIQKILVRLVIFIGNFLIFSLKFMNNCNLHYALYLIILYSLSVLLRYFGLLALDHSLELLTKDQHY